MKSCDWWKMGRRRETTLAVMRRKARVAGAAVGIPQDTEGDATGLKRGWVLHATERNVVLRDAQNSLRVADALAFCAGSIVVQHGVELPLNATFSSNNYPAKYAVAWINSPECDSEHSSAVYVVDFQTGEVSVEHLPNLNEQIGDVFVDSNGKQIAVVGAATGKLYGLIRCNADEWRIVDGTDRDPRAVDACSCGRFVSSVAMGECFMYLRASLQASGSVVVEKWIFDIDAGWATVSFSSRTLGAPTADASHTQALKLFMTATWKFGILTVGGVVYHFQGDHDLRNSLIKRISLDHRVLNGVWIQQDAAFAILLANGQISIAYPDVNSFELLAIATFSTLSKRLSLSALLGKAVSAALQLVWIGQIKHIVVDFGTGCAAFKLEIVDEEFSSKPFADPNGPTKLFPTFAFAQSKRRMVTSLDKDPSNFSECIHEISDAKASPSSNDLLTTAQIIIARSRETFDDMYFTLLCIVHQQLTNDSDSNGKSRDPIDCIGNNLKLMEVLISLTISMEPSILRQIGLRLLSAAPTRSDRKRHYRKEMVQIMQQVKMSMSGVRELEDWWVESSEVKEFLRVYFTTTRALLQEINADSVRRSVGALQNIHLLCELVIDQEDGSTAETIFKADKGDNPLFDPLKRLLVSYTMLCRCLGVNGVLLDLDHIFSLGISSSRKEVFCCFLKPWRCIVNTSGSVSCAASSYMIQGAVRYAVKTDAIHHILKFSLKSKSLQVHSVVQALCKTIALFENKTHRNDTSEVDKLHWDSCEEYISEAMAIFRRLGARRQFKYSHRKAECSAGRLPHPFPFELEFSAYRQTLSNAVTRTTANCDSETSPQWRFSHLDEQLQARVVCLISRIVWHLETAHEEVSNLFEQSFAINCFDPQLESLSTEKETLSDGISKVRAVLFETELCLPRFRQSGDNHERLSVRSRKIVRSLMLLAWGLWIREKAGICARSAHILKGKDGIDVHANKSIGALAAICALHLNALRTLNSDNEELLSTQLSLLEEASTMNAPKTATVIAWGFPPHKIVTRHLKRYQSLRQIVQQASMGVTPEECEQHHQQFQKRIREAFLHVQGSRNQFHGPARNYTSDSDIEVLVSCCCDPEFLQIMSVLAKCPYEVVVTNTPAPGDFSTSEDIVQDELDKSTVNAATDLPPRIGAKSEPVSIRTIEHSAEPRTTESLISRDEVIALLQAQTQHLEEKIQAVTIVTAREHHAQPRESSSSEDIPDTRTKQRTAISDGVKKTVPGKLPDKTEVEKSTSALVELQRMTRISLQVRDLNRRRYSAASSEADIEINQPSKQFQRHDSVRNALKLFRLRQENDGHTRSDSDNESGIAYANGDANTSSNTKAGSNIQNPLTISTRGDTLQRSGIKRNPSKNQRKGLSECPPLKEPVYPLRLEYGTDSASLKLLGRSSQQRNPSVKRRQFIYQESGPPQQARGYRTKPKTSVFDVECTDVIKLKTVSAQTSDIASRLVSTTKAMKELGDQRDDIGPEKASPVLQECDEGKAVARLPHAASESHSQKGVGIQCRMTEDSSVNSARRKRGPPPLNIADKYPIWVDLDSPSSGGEKIRFNNRKKFLQVSRFGGTDAMTSTANNDAAEDTQHFTMPPSVSTVLVPRINNLNSEDGSEENQSDSQHSPSLGNTENRIVERMNDTMKVRYRASYRQHFPVQERPGTTNDDRDSSNGIDSLLDLRDNMQQMTQRLRVLETCANSIDEEFKVSQKRLSRIGDRRPDGVSSRTRVLEGIDEILENTEDAGCQAHGRKPRMSLLSKKASSDMDAAKKLLKTIEQLTISENDR